MTLPFEQALRSELMQATQRRRRRPMPAVAAVAIIAVLLGAFVSSWVDSDTAAADVEITHADGRIVVRLTDLENTPDGVEAATDRTGLDIDIEGVPAGPSHVGRFVGDFSTDADVIDVERLDANGVTYMAFSLPEDWPGELTVYLGQPAGEQTYRIASDAYAPGEPLACSETLGGPLMAIADRVERFDVSVQAFDAHQQSAPAVSLATAIEMGLGHEPITGATAISAKAILIDVGRDVPPREYPPC